MNNKLEIFKNEEFGSVRIIQDGDKYLFCGSDVAKALGYKRTADAITAHCKGVCVLPTPTAGGIQDMKYITEGDVYRLITHSKLPSAECFEKWVFDEVLPTIRKHGAYIPLLLGSNLTLLSTGLFWKLTHVYLHPKISDLEHIS